MRSSLTLLFILLFTGLHAQERLQRTIEWAPEPDVVTWEGERQVQYGFRVLSPGESTVLNNTGADAGAMEWSVEPTFLATFNASPGRAYSVEVLNISTENVPGERNENIVFPTDIVFSTSVSRQPEGYLGKVAAPAIIRTATGLQRITTLDIRIVPTGAGGQARMNFASQSVLRQGRWFRIEVEKEGIHKIDRDFLTGTLGASLDGVDPRTIALYGQPLSGNLPETTNETPPDDLVEMPITIEGESDGSFDGGDFILFHALGPDRRTYDDEQDLYSYTKNIYSTTNSYFLRIGGPTGRRVTQLPAGPGGASATSTYDALYHFEEEKVNILHTLPGNSHGSGQTWYGDFFKVAREKNYENLFRIPSLEPGSQAKLRVVMGLRTDVSSRFSAVVENQRLQSSSAGRVFIGQQEQSPALRRAVISSALTLNQENFSLLIDYPAPAGANVSEAYLDYIDLRARRRLDFANLEQFDFRDAATRKAGATQFNFTSVPADGRVWRVDGADIRAVSFNGTSFSAANGGRLYEYVAFRGNAGLA